MNEMLDLPFYFSFELDTVLLCHQRQREVKKNFSKDSVNIHRTE